MVVEKTTKNLETDDIIRTDTYQYQNSDWEDQLTKFNGQEITYDAIGNPLSIGNSITMEWVNGRSLKSYKDTTVFPMNHIRRLPLGDSLDLRYLRKKQVK